MNRVPEEVGEQGLQGVKHSWPQKASSPTPRISSASSSGLVVRAQQPRQPAGPRDEEEAQQDAQGTGPR